MPQLPLAEAAAQTGLSTDAIRELAHKIVEKRPAVVIAADGNPAIAALNVLLGGVGAPGGIVRKRGDVPSHGPADTVPGPLRAVLIDSTAPWISRLQPMPRCFVSRRGTAAGTVRVGCCRPLDFWKSLPMCPRRPLLLSRRMQWP